MTAHWNLGIYLEYNLTGPEGSVLHGNSWCFHSEKECHPTMTTLQFTLMLISDNSFPSVHFEVSVVPSVKTLVKDRHN